MNESYSLQHTLQLGHRFSLKNQVFEITHVSASKVRYASTHGGRPLTMPTEQFWELVDSNIIGFLSLERNNVLCEPNDFRLSTLDDNSRNELLRRFDYVKEARLANKNTFSSKNLSDAIRVVSKRRKDTSKPGKSTLARWISKFTLSNFDMMSLAPRHRFKGSREKRFPIEIESAIDSSLESDFLTENRCTVDQLYANIIGRLTEIDPPIDSKYFPSIRTVYRRVQELDPYLIAMKRIGKRYADSQFRAAGASIRSNRLMKTVMIDGHKMDVQVIDEDSGEVLGRPCLVCLFDVCTRSVVGWHISLLPFCSTTALAAIKDMCSRDPMQGPGGIPETIVPDNGPDLASHAFRNLCMKLGIHVNPAKAYCPDDKANLERFFRTLNTSLIHTLDGTTFSTLDVRGEYDSLAKANITLHRLRSLVNQWINEIYHVKIHSATHRAPILHWRDQQNEMPIMHFPLDEINSIARVAYRRKISNGRVQHDNLIYKSDALRTLESRNYKDAVILVDELDLSFVLVHPASNSKNLMRADGINSDYMNGLTKFEHDECQKLLKAMEQKDRDELGVKQYEIARYRLWTEIHDSPNSRNSKKLSRLTLGGGHQTTAKAKLAQSGDFVTSDQYSSGDILSQQAPSAGSTDASSSNFTDFEIIEL